MDDDAAAPALSATPSPRTAWGAGRVAFLARLDAIRPELARGVPLTTIYAQHRAGLGIGYAAFVKLVGRYAGEARVVPRRPRAVPATASTAVPVPQVAAAASSPPAPRPARTFHYDPVWQPGEEDRLIGSTAARPRGFVHDPVERPGDRKRLLGED